MKKSPGSTAAIAGIVLVCFLLFQKSGFSGDPATQREPGYLAAGGGAYSILDLWATTGFVNVLFQPGVKLWILRPQAGAFVSFSGAVMVYGGLTWPAEPVKWLIIETGAAAGYYENGQGIDLGYPLEFRLSVSVLYRFRNYSQIGVEIAHISNCDLSAHNPGTESLSVIFKLPLRKRKAY